MYRMRPRFTGLGYTYDDILAQAGREQCDPLDSACVARNQQRVNAAMDLYYNVLAKGDTSGAAPSVTITPDTSQAATLAFMNNQPVEAAISVSGQPVVAATSGTIANAGVLANVYNPSVIGAQGQELTYQPGIPIPSAVVNSSGGQNAPAALTTTVSTVPTTGTPVTPASSTGGAVPATPGGQAAHRLRVFVFVDSMVGMGDRCRRTAHDVQREPLMYRLSGMGLMPGGTRSALPTLPTDTYTVSMGRNAGITLDRTVVDPSVLQASGRVTPFGYPGVVNEPLSIPEVDVSDLPVVPASSPANTTAETGTGEVSAGDPRARARAIRSSVQCPGGAGRLPGWLRCMP